MSESISLFQALEVRHEPSEEQKTEQNSMYHHLNCNNLKLNYTQIILDTGKQVGGTRDNGSFCFRPDGVAIFGLIITFILISSTTFSISSFIKMKKIRKMYDMQNEGSLFGKHPATGPALSYENLCYNNYNRRRF